MQTGSQRGGVRPLAALVTAGVALVTGCNPPGPEAKVAAGATRLSYPVPAGYRVSYLRAGDPAGRRIILVHGTPGAAEGWLDYLTNVPAGFEHIAVDRPGFGESGPVHGRKGGLVPYANVPFMQTRFTGAPLNVVTLPEADHFIVWNQIATVRAAIARAAEAGVGRC
jgi:hypothetical protein